MAYKTIEQAEKSVEAAHMYYIERIKKSIKTHGLEPTARLLGYADYKGLSNALARNSFAKLRQLAKRLNDLEAD